MSLEDLAYEARRHGAPTRFVGSWLSKVLSGGRPYDAALLAALARALGHEPEELLHYRLAVAVQAIDEATKWSEVESILSSLRNIETVAGITRRMADRFAVSPEDQPGSRDGGDATTGSPRAADEETTAGEATPEP